MDPMLLMVGVLGFVAVAGVGLVFAGVGSGSAKTAKRIQALAQKGKGRQGMARQAPNDAVAQRRKQLQRTLQEH
jgi:tight adherence protein B